MTEDELIEAAGVRLVERLAALAGTPRPPATDPLDASRAATVTPRGSADPDAAMPTVAAMRRALDGGQTTPRALLDQCLARIARLDGHDLGRSSASLRRRGWWRRTGRARSLRGRALAGTPPTRIPFAIQDAFRHRRHPHDGSARGSIGGAQFPAADAALVERLRAARRRSLCGQARPPLSCDCGGPSRERRLRPRAGEPLAGGMLLPAAIPPRAGACGPLAAGLRPLAFGEQDTGGFIPLPRRAGDRASRVVKPSHGCCDEGLYPLSDRPSIRPGRSPLTVEDCGTSHPTAPFAPACAPRSGGCGRRSDRARERTARGGILSEGRGARWALRPSISFAAPASAVRPVDPAGRGRHFTTGLRPPSMMPDRAKRPPRRPGSRRKGEAARMSWQTRARPLARRVRAAGKARASQVRP